MKYVIQPSRRARDLVAKMSLREALAQVSCPLLNFQTSDLFGAAHMPWATPEVMAARAARMKAACPIPPLFTADLECGPGTVIKGFTKFPDFMALGACDDEQLAYDAGRITALEGLSVGVNWTFAPVVDIAVNPDSPVLSTRSAGRTPERVIRTARGYLRGLQDHGFLATLKHFPGDGYTTYDQHLTTVNSPLTMEEWRQGPGRVYRELTEAGARTVMIGHIALPAWDEPDPAMGLFPPATLSRRIITDLLKGEVGFSGLVVSDAMGMGGVAGFANLHDAYARFLEAGGDVVLFPKVDDGRYFDEMEKRLRSGMLKEATVYDRAARVVAVKEDLGLLDGEREQKTLDREAHRAVAMRVIEDAPALVRDRKATLPFRIGKATRVLHVVVAPNYSIEKGVYDALTAALSARCEVTEVVDPGPQRIYELVSSGKFDLVLCSIGAHHSWAVSVTRLHGPICRNLMDGWMRLGVPVVFVEHFHPFVHLEYEALMDCVIATFRSLEATGERLVQGITGEKPFTGKP